MKVQKLKNQFSNKIAPSTDVSKKVKFFFCLSTVNIFICQIMRTEIVRHIFTGGKLNQEGTECAAANVLEEAVSCQPFRMLLGIQDPKVETGWFSLFGMSLSLILNPGKASMQDWLRGKVRRTRPEASHIGKDNEG